MFTIAATWGFPTQVMLTVVVEGIQTIDYIRMLARKFSSSLFPQFVYVA